MRSSTRHCLKVIDTFRRSSNRACEFPAHGSPTGIYLNHRATSRLYQFLKLPKHLLNRPRIFAVVSLDERRQSGRSRKRNDRLERQPGAVRVVGNSSRVARFNGV